MQSIWGQGGKQGVGVRTELKVLQKSSAKKIEDKYPIKFLPDQAFKMPAAKLHMLLVLLVGQDESVLAKANKSALKALITAYAKEGAKAQVGGKKEKLLTVLAQAVRAAGAGGFVRDPVFGDAEEGAVVEGEGAAVEGAGTGGGE